MTVLALALPLLVWDLTESDGGLVSGGTPGQWEWAIPREGPELGSPAWCTAAASTYLHEADDTLELPALDLSEAARPSLLLTHWYDVRAGDRAVLEVDDGGGWAVADVVGGYPDADGFVGASDGFVTDVIDLRGWGEAPRVRLRFTTDASLAAAGWVVTGVGLYDGDVSAPRVAPISLPEDTQDLDGPYVVELEVLDDADAVSVSVFYAAGGSAWRELTAARDGDRATVEIPAQPPGTEVVWYAEADDGSWQTRWPEVGAASFRVFLAAPQDLHTTADRLVGQTVELDWLPPDSPHPVLEYELLVDGVVAASLDRPPGEVPIEASGPWGLAVRALYDAGIGDTTDEIVVDVDVPVLELQPAWAWQGDQVRVTLTGENLYLDEDSTALSLGQGVTTELEVLDVGRATALVTLTEHAEVGLRACTVSGAFGAYTFPEAFEVLPGEDRPSVVEVLPDEVQQGETREVTIVASEPLAGEVSVDVGEGLVASTPVVDGDEVRFELAAAVDAAPGSRSLILDDGTRLWQAEIRVVNVAVPPQPTCATASARGAWMVLLLPLLGWRQRRRSASRAARDSA